MPNEELPVPLFRAYLSRKPGGLLLVTVLSTLLPRPLFRMYPAELGEAAAVERSVGHAMCALKKRAPGECQQGDNPCFKTVFSCCHEQHEGYPDNVCEHIHALLPAVNVVVAEPLQSALPCGPQHEHSHADKREEQHAAHGNGEFKKLGGWEEFQHGSPHGLHQPREHAAIRSEEQAGADGYAVKQHLRLRVVWQGLL